jgi:outer membrane receptor for ferrienterochelin and colicins
MSGWTERACALALALTLAAAGSAAAQEGGTSGVVVDATTGEPLAGATIVRSDGAVAAVTDGGGRWRVEGLAAGVELRVVHVGYAERRFVAADLEAGEPVELTPRPVALDALVVTAGRRVQRLADAVHATELVSAREIRETGASDAASVLVERTGIELSGGHPSGAGVMLEGLGAERVLVLVDGQPFIGRISGETDLSRIPADVIERIEVVKGPQSTLYGSDAMAGVVNVITRSPSAARWSGSARATYGSRGRTDVSGLASGSAGGFSALVQGGRRFVEVAPGVSAETGAQARRWDGAVRAQWRASDEADIELSAFGVEERQRWRIGQLYQFADNRQLGGRVGGTWRPGAHRLSTTLYATGFDHLPRSATLEDPVAGTGATERQRLLQATLLYGTTLRGAAVDVGAEVRREELRSERVRDGVMELDGLGVFAQATAALGPVTLVPGLRLSARGPWGEAWTPHLAALVRPRGELALRASVGAGYRAPAFKELAMQFLNVGPGYGYVVRGNPDVEPERSWNVTGSAEWAGERLYVRAQGFHNAFDDFIETRLLGDSAGLQVYTYGNVSSGTTSGLELEAATTWGRWRAESGYSWLRAVAESGEPLLGRPGHSGRLAVSYASPAGTRLSATALRTGSTPIGAAGDVTQERSAFTRIDVRAARTLRYGLELEIGADNVFDARPDHWPGFAGRHLSATLRWSAAAQ